MLSNARKELPESVLQKERFEIPTVKGHIQGNKTVISNFHSIAEILRRPSDHIVKFVLKELATPGELKKTALIIGTKVSSTRINEKIRQYANTFVLCKVCGKPDTKITKEKKLSYMKCMACGTKYPIIGKI